MIDDKPAVEPGAADKSAVAVDPSTLHDPGGKTYLKMPAEWTTTVEFSDCGRYRYKLHRCWDADGPVLLVVMTNPSIANAAHNDPTVAKCCRIAQNLGFGSVFIGNVCAYRATNKRWLLEVADPVGPRNQEALWWMVKRSSMVIVGHGQLPGRLQRHADAAVRVLRGCGLPLHVLGLSREGIPMHPLARGRGHIPVTVQPVLWDVAEQARLTRQNPGPASGAGKSPRVD